MNKVPNCWWYLEVPAAHRTPPRRRDHPHLLHRRIRRHRRQGCSTNQSTRRYGPPPRARPGPRLSRAYRVRNTCPPQLLPALAPRLLPSGRRRRTLPRPCPQLPTSGGRSGRVPTRCARLCMRAQLGVAPEHPQLIGNLGRLETRSVTVARRGRQERGASRRQLGRSDAGRHEAA